MSPLLFFEVVAMPRRSARSSASAPPSPGVSPEVLALREDMEKLKEDHAAERLESQLRIQLLEGRLARGGDREKSEEKRKRKGKKRSRSPSSSENSSSESSSSESSSGCSSSVCSSSESDCKSRRSHRRKSKSKKSKKHRVSSRRLSSKLSSRRWKTRSYEVQHELNAALLSTLRKTRKSLKRLKGGRRAAKRVKEGESLLSARQEWLAVADTHGHEAASKFQEGGEMLDIVSSSSKCKKLMAAIQSTKQKHVQLGRQPFRSGAPANSGKSWGTNIISQPVTPSMPAVRHARPVCHRCGSPDHFVKFCPQQAHSTVNPVKQA